MKDLIISTRDLQFGYASSGILWRRQPAVKLFHGLDLDIRRGGIYGLLGRNGSGKSTLLKLLTGCLYPDGGAINLFGAPASARRADQLARLLFLPEQVYLPARSWEVLAQAYGPLYPNFDGDAFRQNLLAFDVPTGRKLTALSLGQKKKGLISFALACNTELLVLDEPSNGLDIPSKAQLRSILAECAADDRTIIVSTHQVRDLNGLIDSVIIIDRGKVLVEANMERLGQALHFELVSSLTPPADVLYAERAAGGHLVIKPNVGGRYTEPDVELLFNAVVQRESAVLALLDQHLTPQTA